MSASAKLVRLSNDNGVSWATLAGNDASLTLDGSELDTGVFGTAFNQSITGILSHSLSGNAMLRKTAGYEAKIKRVGASTPVTDEPMSLVSGKTYHVTDITKSLLDFTQPVTFSDGGTPVSAANILRVDHLVGRVVFVDSYTPTGPITVTGNYLPTSVLACARELSVSQSADTIEVGCFNTISANGGYELYRSTLKSVSAEASDFYRTNSDWFQLLLDRDEVVLEVDWDGKGSTICRGLFRVLSDGFSGGIGGDESESISFVLSAPEDVTPFAWRFASNSEAPLSVRMVVTAWEQGNELTAQYLPNGVGQKGWQGKYIVTDCSLSTSVDGLGEMSVDLQGTDSITPINV